MKKHLWLGVLLVGCCGCGTIANSVVPAAGPVPLQEQVTLGMTYPNVALVMNGSVVVGYEIDPATGASKPITVQRLYSSEMLNIKDQAYKVDLYILRSPVTGAGVNEGELFPVVYKDGLVVAKGRDGLARIRLGK